MTKELEEVNELKLENERLKSLLKPQAPLECEYEEDRDDECICPNCNNVLWKGGQQVCEECGQRLKWEDEND